MQNLALDFSFHDNATETKEHSLVDRWKQDLKKTFEGFFTAAKKYEQAVSSLCRYIEVKSISTESLYKMEEIIDKWIKNTCELANSEADNMSHLTISESSLPSELRTFKFPRARSFYAPEPTHNGKEFSDLTNDELMDFFFTTYDFNALEQTLEKAKAEIENLGFITAANKIGCEFDLVKAFDWKPDTLEIKQQKGRFIIELPYHDSYQWNRINNINELNTACRTFETESEVYGLSKCLTDIVREERALRSSEDRVISRTKVNEGGNVEAVFFKDKLKFHFKSDYFEALISFIKSFSDKDPVKLVQK